MIVTADEIQKEGVLLFKKVLKGYDEAFINIQGENKYVVVDIKKYQELKESEIELLYLKGQLDIEEGRYKKQSLTDHVKELFSTL